MGTAARLTHHVLVSKRRGNTRRRHTPRAHLRRVQHWVEGAASSTAAEAASLAAPWAVGGTATTNPAWAAPAAALPGATTADAPREPSVLDMPLAQLHWRDPITWLRLGWQDFQRAPAIGLFYGLCFVAMGWLLLACFEYAAQYTLALSAGFLLMGPFLCLGLYEVSRRLQGGEPVSLGQSLVAWRKGRGQLAVFACVLLVMEMLWGRAAMVVFAVSFDGVPDLSGPISTWMTADMITFLVTYTVVGAIFAGLIFAISVISMPMMLDLGTDAVSAGLTSMRLVFSQSGVMLLWGGLITMLIGVAMLPGFLGLLVAGPVLGHASWHAYKAATAGAPWPRER
jgi:uncharacterized membrane protein